MKNELPVLRKTDMITVRNAGGRQAFTYQDMADALQVTEKHLRDRFSRNKDAWKDAVNYGTPSDEAETFTVDLDTPGGVQQIRIFTPRGAMRFCRYVKSGRSDQLFNHLLDLWEAEKGMKQAPVRNAISEIDRMAGMMNQMIPVITGRISEISTKAIELEDRVNAVEATQKNLDPREIEVRMWNLHQCKKLLVNGTKGKPQAVTYNIFWNTLKEHCQVASFTNRAALTVATMEKAIAYAHEWCRTRGVNPPTLFDHPQDKAV